MAIVEVCPSSLRRMGPLLRDALAGEGELDDEHVLALPGELRTAREALASADANLAILAGMLVGVGRPRVRCRGPRWGRARGDARAVRSARARRQARARAGERRDAAPARRQAWRRGSDVPDLAIEPRTVPGDVGLPPADT